MARLYKHSVEGAIICDGCLNPHELTTAAELFPRFFPGTYDKLNCARCGAAGDTAGPVLEAESAAE